MKLIDIINRDVPARPWSSAEKIPWNDPEFSQRMLENHLSQDHDWASRRLSIINQQVDWIIAQRPVASSTRILDLGCGPGFYTHRLAQSGYRCVGIDFSPASIDYAKLQAAKDNLAIEYILADVRQCEVQGTFDIVMMTFGELNVFSRADAEDIIIKAKSCLKPDGILVMEVHVFDEVRRQGLVPASWQTALQGLFSSQPHAILQENYWDESLSSCSTRYYIVDAESAKVTEYGASMQAYTDEQYLALLANDNMRNIRKLSADEWPVGDIFIDKLEVYVGYK